MNEKLPRGTVTFLFTDIEAHTQLWQAHPQTMPAALANHDAILDKAVSAANGLVVKTTGDGIFAVFESAGEAVEAAVHAQLTLANYPWGETGQLRVRMAIHSGEAQIRDGDYFGTAVIRAARIMSLAAGGQILISGSTVALIRDHLSPPLSLIDLGHHRLKGLERPAQIFQLQHTALPAQFPELKSLDSIPNNLPLQLTSFIGREREIGEVVELLAGKNIATHPCRLVTLAGTGGTGKTRLSLQVAAELFNHYSDGVWFLELAALTDEAQVPQAMVSTLKLGEPRNITLFELLISYLRTRKVLIVIDNCEHLIGACATLCDHLLRNCPELQLIATSREALGIGGETIYTVPTLGVLDSLNVTAKDLLKTDAGQLFTERATTVKPKFTVDDDNAKAIAQICQRLDGIPLAIELAAARANVFTPLQILERLGERFNLLIGGSRAALPRQQTLSALIDWSYQLLTTEEKSLLRRLSVFKGGWLIDAVEAVGTNELDELLFFPNLINKSLVIIEESDGEHRYRLLESIRRYALDKLILEDEEAQARILHLAYFKHLAVSNRPQTADVYPDGSWFARCQQELDNFRAALTWAIEHDPDAALGICGTLVWFWSRRGYAQEGREWLKNTLEASIKLPIPNNKKDQNERNFGYALSYLGLCQLGIILGNFNNAQDAAVKSVELFRNLAQNDLLPFALGLLAFASSLNNDFEMTKVANNEAMAKASEAGDLAALSLAYGLKGALLARRGEDLAEAQFAAEEGLRYARESRSGWGKLVATVTLARELNAAGHRSFNYRQVFGELIDAFMEFEDFYFANVCRSELAHAERMTGHDREAKALYRETIVVWRDLGQKAAVAHQLECFAFVQQAGQQYETATMLLGAAKSLREQVKAVMIQSELEEYNHHLAQLRQQIPSNVFTDSWRIGESMEMNEAIELLLKE